MMPRTLAYSYVGLLSALLLVTLLFVHTSGREETAGGAFAALLLASGTLALAGAAWSSRFRRR